MKPREEIITEREFLKVAQETSTGFLRVTIYLSDNKGEFTKRFYVHVMKEATELEDFLDDHGASANKRWVLFRKLVASIRNLSTVAYIVKHIERRYPLYELEEDFAPQFTQGMAQLLHFLDKGIVSLFERVGREGKKLGLRAPTEALSDESFEEVGPTKRLPHNIGEEEVYDERRNVLKIATSYLHLAKEFTQQGFDHVCEDEELFGLVPEKVSEEGLRDFELGVHSLQSMYDTYIKSTPTEAKSTDLHRLRGYVSVSLHLLEVARGLSHFYERHEDEIRHEKTVTIIESIVNKREVLSGIINFALFYCHKYLQGGERLAKSVLRAYVEMGSIEVSVPANLGFHMRPSTLVAKIVNHYGSDVTMIVGDKRFDAGSPLDLMWAGGLLKREGIETVILEGDNRVLGDLKTLADVNYGEDIMGRGVELPPELKYLR